MQRGLRTTLLRPAINNAAQQAVAAPLASQSAQVAQVAKNQAALGNALQSLSPSLVIPTVPVAVASPAPVHLRLPGNVSNFPANSTTSQSYTVPAKSTLSMADILFENPAGDSGTLEVLQNTTVLLVENLNNFRDLDYHFVSPPVFSAGQQIVLQVNCAKTNGVQATPPASGTACTPAIFIPGFLTTS